MILLDYWKIKEARKYKKMTQEQLADLLGVKRAVISKYESGVITPSVEQAKKICEHLDIPFLDLIGVGPENDSDYERKRFEKLILEHIGNSDNFDLNKLHDVYYYDDNGLRFKGDNINFDELVSTFDQLNNAGQQKVADYAKDLTHIPEYRREPL